MDNTIEQLLLFIFEEGLDEDAEYRFGDIRCDESMLLHLKNERIKINDESLRAKLLDLLIEDITQKEKL